MKNFKIFLFVVLIAGISFSAKSFLFSDVNAQVSKSDSSDAIAVRIIPNPNHYSISRWYASQGFSGAPQDLTVDGYEAVRDGRTVYVNATNVEGKNIYTNVYLISYNQNSTDKTVDILGQIISHWKFNSNVGILESTNPLPSCAISNKSCSVNSDCGDDQLCATSGNASSSCVLKVTKNCLIDSDCPSNFFCNSLKSKIIRDAKRIGQLEELKEGLFKYKEINKTFPILKAGTYLPNHSISAWPSWSQNLIANLKVSSNFLDPINRLGACSGYDIKTCWNPTLNKFVYTPSSSYLMLPAGSYAFVYKTDANGSNYNLCATLESRDPSLDYHFAPNDPSASACLIATGITTGGTALNTAPILRDMYLSGEAGQEFNGFIRVTDNENNPLSWTIYTSGTNWKNWQNNNVSNVAPVLKYSNVADQKKVYANLAGDPGDYAFSFKVEDGNGGVLSTSTIIKITNSAPLIEADDGTYVLSTDNPFSYSFNFSDSNLATPETSYSVTKVSGPYDIWADSKTVTFTSIGVNKYKVTHSGFISAANKLSQDTDFSYKIKVTDRYGASATKNIVIRVVVEKTLLDFNCASKVRIGRNYYCVLGSAISNGRQNIVYTSKTPLLSNLIISKDQSSIFSISGVVSELGITNTEIVSTDEYGETFKRPFVLQSYNYCGDGQKEFPNTEGQGGYYNDGYEDCDGSDGLASTAAASSATKQYACSTKPGEITPDIITSNTYCVFASPLNGGGYCGDGICSSATAGGLETPCNCEKDCGPGINCSGVTACSYTYSWGPCQTNNTQTGTVVSATPAGCVGTPQTTQACTYVPPVLSCHTQADCLAGYTCKSSSADPSVYYCTGWEGSHGCTSPVAGQNCYNIPASTSYFNACETNCNKLRAVTINNVANTGLCTWSVQNGVCYKDNICSSWTYTNWSACSAQSQQTRTVINSYPAGCTGGTPDTSQSCAPTCTSWTYSAWGTCSAQGQQTRTITSSTPAGCTGGIPVTSQSCTPTCNSWTYTDWTACTPQGSQTRTIVTSVPAGCTGGSSVTSQSCTYVPNACTWTYGAWSACSAQGQQTRTALSSTPPGCSGAPVTSQSCTPICTSWTYSAWSACSAQGQQTRTVLASSPSGCSGGAPVTSQSCTPTCTSWTYSDWGTCSDQGQQTRTVLTSSPSGCSGGTPNLSQTCLPTCTSYVYSDWETYCYSTGIQYRSYISSLPVGCVGGPDFVLSRSCTPTCTGALYSDWTACSADGKQTRTVTSYLPDGCSGGFTPVTSQDCVYTPPATTCTDWTYSLWGACSGGQQTRSVLSSSPAGCTGGSPVTSQSCCTSNPSGIYTGAIYSATSNCGHTLDCNFTYNPYTSPSPLPQAYANKEGGGCGVLKIQRYSQCASLTKPYSICDGDPCINGISHTNYGDPEFCVGTYDFLLKTCVYKSKVIKTLSGWGSSVYINNYSSTPMVNNGAVGTWGSCSTSVSHTDGICSVGYGETCSNAPADCGVCATIDCYSNNDCANNYCEGLQAECQGDSNCRYNGDEYSCSYAGCNWNVISPGTCVGY
jgi:hypothetical protein